VIARLIGALPPISGCCRSGNRSSDNRVTHSGRQKSADAGSTAAAHPFMLVQ
jgi:hypothetical protein